MTTEKIIQRIRRADKAAVAEGANPKAQDLVSRAADHLNKCFMTQESAPAVAKWQMDRARMMIRDAEKLLDLGDQKGNRSGRRDGGDKLRKTRRTGKTARKKESEGYRPHSQKKAEKAERDREIRQRMQGRKGG